MGSNPGDVINPEEIVGRTSSSKQWAHTLLSNGTLILIGVVATRIPLVQEIMGSNPGDVTLENESTQSQTQWE
ncbi:hypothetical protein TorRG33x02_031590 [Trema orientale]|uniref:Uncharacterized protein n=1 Tax=Trema orientale TaxID=63057 RepID=A0A2P5FT57_TREOI|nr:hypothetical protein TorRG33x02_031590 [Trema orientale]